MPQAVPRQPLLALLARNEEDRFTEYLYHLLGWDDVLSELLNLCGASGVKCNVVEVSIWNFVAGSYPDLAIQGPDFHFVFEAKLMSGLGTNQVVPYAQALLDWQRQNPNGTIALFIIAPRKSLQGLVNEAQLQLTNNRMTAVPVETLAWEEIADRLQRLSQQTQDQRLQVYLQDFANVVSARIGKLHRPFTPEEALLLSDQQAGMALRRVWFLTEELKDKVQHGLQFPLDCKRDEGSFWAGFGFWHQRKNLGWLGVWIDAWDGVGKSPLFYQLPEIVRQHLQDIVRDATVGGYPVVEQFNDGRTNHMVVPLPIKTGPLNDVVTYLAKVVIGYINLIYPLIP